MASIPRKQLIGTAGVCAIMVGAFALASQNRPDDAPQLATYEPQSAFEQYHGAAGLQAKLQQMQLQMQEAQQRGDAQRAMEIQAMIEQERSRVVEQFYSDVKTAAAKIADEQRIDILAVEIVYTADRVGEPKDVTQQLVTAINKDAEPEQPMQP